MDWDEMLEEVEGSTSDIDKGIVGTIDLERLGGRDSRGKFVSGGGKQEYWKELTGEEVGGIEDVVVNEEDFKEEVVDNRFVGLTDKEIAQKVMKSSGREKSKPEIVSSFKTRFDKNWDWVPHKSLFSENISKSRRSKVWIVKGLLLIRDDGRCRVCGERVRGNTWKVLKEDKRKGWSEDNCYVVCKECGLCHVNKLYGGVDRLGRFKAMKLFVLKRRNRGVKECGSLGEFGGSVLMALRREEYGASGNVDSSIMQKEVRRRSKERSRLVY
jgi:hypothetical protein